MPPDSPMQAALRAIYAEAVAARDAGPPTARHPGRHGDVLRVTSPWADAHVTLPARVSLLAAGKAAPGMAHALATLLGPRLQHALVIAPDGLAKPPGLETLYAAHPIPDARSLLAGARA